MSHAVQVLKMKVLGLADGSATLAFDKGNCLVVADHLAGAAEAAALADDGNSVWGIVGGR